MKKRIIAGLVVLSAILFALIASTIASMEHATTRLERLITLHQIEIARERLLIQLKRAQSDLYLKNTRHAQSIDTIVGHVRGMNAMVDACFECHRADGVTGTLEDLRSRIGQYESALSRVLTMRANQARLAVEEDSAYRIGNNLVSQVDGITTRTNAKLGERTREASRDVADTKRMLYLLLGVAPFVASALAVLLIRGFTKPIDVLLTATRRLKGGDLSYRIEGLRNEYGEVAESFNEMAGSLQAHWQKMQWAEQIVVLGELAGGLAHEINNPLAGIKASMELLSEDKSLPEDQKELVVEVIRQIERIELLVRSLLNFAKPPKPQFMAVDLNEVVDATVSLARKHPLFLSKDGRTVLLELDYDPSLPRIMADPLQLQQVFLNLLLNAADAMPGGGTVTAQTGRDDAARFVRVTIADTGRGVDESVINKIFLPFFTTKAKGTGLGLATTKRLVEQHGGSITVANRPERGAAFSVTLPVEQDVLS